MQHNNNESSFPSSFPVMSKIFPHQTEASSTVPTSSDLTRLGKQQLNTTTSNPVISLHTYARVSSIELKFFLSGDCTSMLPPHDDLAAAQHYQMANQNQHYQGYNCNSQPDFSNYGPMYSNYIKCRTSPYQRSTPGAPASPSNMLPPSAAMYYPGFSNAAAAAAAAAAGLYSRPHNVYDYAANNGSSMHPSHASEVPR